MSPLVPLSLGCHSEQVGDECCLTANISFPHASSLPFANHIHDLISRPRSLCCRKRKETHPSFGQSLDEAMVLFNSVVEIFDLTQFTAFRDDPLGFQLLERFWIRGVFVDIDHPRSHCMRSDEGFVEKPLGRFGIPCRTQPAIERVSDGESAAR